MSIEEFKKTLEIIKEDWNNESHSYKNENYFIYIKENVENHINMLQQNPSRVAKYFKHHDIQYAA
ncbi:MAG: hypothetical protein LBR13_04810 [Dysgonamonadaceae bacterium]|jgi:hypothetical protein|nr:hypothetical protein [Dysgonamonadaceae bacterium]